MYYYNYFIDVKIEAANNILRHILMEVSESRQKLGYLDS